jgi:hypothetical protein
MSRKARISCTCFSLKVLRGKHESPQTPSEPCRTCMTYQQMSSFFLAYSLRSRLNSDLNWLSNFLFRSSPSFVLSGHHFEGRSTPFWNCLYEDPNLVPHTYIVGVASLRVLPRCSEFPLANFVPFILYHILLSFVKYFLLDWISSY